MTDEEAQAKADSATSLATISEALTKLLPDDRTKLIGLLTGTKPKTESGGATGGLGASNIPPAGVQDQASRILDESKIPKLPKFSGTGAKSEPSYRVWRFELDNLKETYRDIDVKRAIQRSVTGSAAEVFMRLGQNASLDQVLDKFEHVYGTVSSTEKLLCDFYSTQQRASETVAEWSCRLEDILSHRQLQSMAQRETMLKSKFFSGLHSSQVKNAVRHKFEEKPYEEILVLAREAEEEFKMEKAVAKPQVVEPSKDKLEQVMKELKEIRDKLAKWDEQTGRKNQPNQDKTLSKPSSNQEVGKSSTSEVTCYYCKKKGHVKRNCPKLLNKKRSVVEGSQ